MIEFLLRFFYGAIVSSGGFLIASMGRLAIREVRAIGLRAAMSSVYFWLTTTMAGHGLALVIICAIRLFDSFHGGPRHADNAFGWVLVIGFGLLLVSKIGFNWAGTRTFAHGRQIWFMFVATLVLWAVFLSVWTYVR